MVVRQNTPVAFTVEIRTCSIDVHDVLGDWGFNPSDSVHLRKLGEFHGGFGTRFFGSFIEMDGTMVDPSEKCFETLDRQNAVDFL